MMGVSLAGFIVTAPVSALLKPTRKQPGVFAAGCVCGIGSTHTRWGLVMGAGQPVKPWLEMDGLA